MEQFILISLITLFGAMSPGPDFIIVVKNSLSYGKSGGIATSLGIGLGIVIHVFYCILGIALIVSKSILLFNIIKIFGAIYLIYLGIQLFLAKKEEIKIEKNIEINKKSIGKCLLEGFLNSALNPKTTIFFLAVFTQVISPNTLLAEKIFLGLDMIFIITFWFIFLSFVINLKTIKNKIFGLKYWIEKILGGLLVFLGIKIISE